MFSSRLGWPFTPNCLAECLKAKKARGVSNLDLTVSNPTRAGFSYQRADILQALTHSESMVYRPSPRGLPAARRAVAAYYRDLGQDIDPDSIFLTASTSEAYAYLFKLLADAGDEILVPRPAIRCSTSSLPWNPCALSPTPWTTRNRTGRCPYHAAGGPSRRESHRDHPAKGKRRRAGQIRRRKDIRS